MGIKNLHQILGEHAPDCYKTKNLSDYAFQKIGIDISLYLYKYKASLGERWIEAFISMISCLRKWDIHSFFIYDGKAPIEKLAEQQRRRESMVKQGDRAQLLEKEIDEFEATGKVGEMIKDICKKKSPPQALFVRSVPKDQNIDIQIAKERLGELKGMMISITAQDIQLSKDLFDILQVPYTTAPDEAERFAAHLCVHGIIDGVLSEDTDVLVYGTPLFLTKIDIYKNTVVELKYSEIIETMDMTSESFTDLCIMCGCDYNDNIFGYGCKKTFDLLKKHKNIEAVIEEIKKIEVVKKEKKIKKMKKDNDDRELEDLDYTVLKHVRCRELFSIPETVDFYAPFCGTPDFEKLSEFLFCNGIKTNLETLKKNLQTRTIVFEED
jgi:flap endonuclease-1